MTYLINASKGRLINGTAYGSYLKYLDSIKTNLPNHVFEFATADWHYDFTNPRCLHDAWLERIVITENAAGTRNELRSIAVALHLLGAYQDRMFKIFYSDVSSYEIKSPSVKQGHGDLIIDEIGLSLSNYIVHQMRFSTGAVLKIECVDFKFYEEAMDGQAKPNTETGSNGTKIRPI